MNKDRWFSLAVAANLLSLAVCALYAGGGPLTMALMPCLHILLFWLNMKGTKTWGQAILLGLLHIAVTFCIHQQSSWLYFRYIVDDAEGRMVALLECTVGVTWTGILFIASLIWFGLKQRNVQKQKGTAAESRLPEGAAG